MPADLDVLLPFRAPSASRPAAARLRLVCLPFAGGTASVFRDWGAGLPPDVDVCAVELPGHGTRLGEVPVSDPRALVAELTALLRPLADLPVVYFGHSLGGRIAFALARAGARADALIVSGSRAPHLPARRVRSTMSREALIAELGSLGGTPRVILDDQELVDLFLPLIRADFALVERLVCGPLDQIDAPLIALGAAGDSDALPDEVAGWQVHAGAGYRHVAMPGNHFFLHTHKERVLAEVATVIGEVLNQRA